MNAKTNCAGYECEERDTCRRYVQRIPDRWEDVIINGSPAKFPIYEWGSFDIEKVEMGDCAARLEVR